MSGERDVAYEDTVYGVRRALDILDSPRPMIEVASAVVAGVIAVRDRDEALAQRDAARDIAARLEGELARAAERASRESIRDVLRANLFDGSDEGLTTMPAKVFLDDASEVIADWLTTDPDTVIAEGES